MTDATTNHPSGERDEHPLRRLAREQGIRLDGPRPDYVALATALFETEEEVADFNNYLVGQRMETRDA